MHTHIKAGLCHECGHPRAPHATCVDAALATQALTKEQCLLGDKGHREMVRP